MKRRSWKESLLQHGMGINMTPEEIAIKKIKLAAICLSLYAIGRFSGKTELEAFCFCVILILFHIYLELIDLNTKG